MVGSGPIVFQLVVDQSVLTKNVAEDSGGAALVSFGQTEIRETLIADNTSAGISPDCSASGGIESNGFNLVGVNCGIVPTIGDLFGDSASPVAPSLSPLGAYGGPTLTHRLLAGSVAIDAGDPACGFSEDQRGLPRPADGDGDTIAACDIGSFEVQSECSDGLDDDGDGLVDFPDDPGCDDALDRSERSDLIACDDGLDNDGDGAFDFPWDTDCSGADGLSEVPEPSTGTALVFGAAALLAAGRSRRRMDAAAVRPRG